MYPSTHHTYRLKQQNNMYAVCMLYDIAQVVPTVTQGACTLCKMKGRWYFQTVNHALHKSMQELHVGVEDLTTQTNN